MPFKKSIRLKNYDYSTDGGYFITICTYERKRIINEAYKKTIINELTDLEKRFKGIFLDIYVIMPNHCHIIFIFRNSKVTLPKVIQAFKSLSTLKIKRLGYKDKIFWQKNYYERVIRNEEALNKIRQYIINNPEKEELEFTINGANKKLP